jgi:hypothetical protein
MNTPTERSWLQRVRDGLVEVVDRPVPAWPAAVLRVVIAFALYRESVHNIDRLVQYTDGQYSLPLLPGIRGLSYASLLALCSWQKWLALLAVPGLFSRFFLAGAVACQGYLFAISALNFRNHIVLLCVVGALVALSAPDRVLSLRYLLERLGVRALAPRTGRTPAWRRAVIRPGALRLVQLQVCAVYFYAALHKHVAGFADGYPLCASFWRYFRTSRLASWLQADEPALPWLLARITDDPGGLYLAIEAATDRAACQTDIVPVLVYAAIATIVVEYLLAFGLLFRRANYVVAIFGIGMHGFIFLGMNVETFGTVMIGSYVLFFGAPPANAFIDGVRGRCSNGAPGDARTSAESGANANIETAAPRDARIADENGNESSRRGDAPTATPSAPSNRRRKRTDKRG